MHRFVVGAAVCAALVLLVASAAMNYSFASSLGRTAVEAYILGSVSIGVDVLKAALAVLIGVAAREKRWGFVAIGGTAFVLFTTLSVVAAFGFSASNRHAVVGERERGNHRLTAVGSQLAELRAKLKALPQHRPVALVDEALAVLHIDVRWQASRQCTELNSARIRTFCEEVARLRGERAAADYAAKVEKQIGALEAEAQQLRQMGGGTASDAQALALSQAFGLDEAQVQRAVSALLALVVEIGSSLGAYIALGASPVSRKPERRAIVETAAEQETDKGNELAAPAAETETSPPPPTMAERPAPRVAIRVRPTSGIAHRNGRDPAKR